jgi:hypothetical protein
MYMHARVYVHVCVCVHVCMHIYIYIYIHMCTCVCVYMCIYTHVHTHIHVYIYTRINKYTCVNSHASTCKGGGGGQKNTVLNVDAKRKIVQRGVTMQRLWEVGGRGEPEGG